MRRVWFSMAVAFGFVLSGGAAFGTTPNPSSSASGLAIPVAAAKAPTTMCQISSGGTGAVYMTGLVATKSGYVAVDAENPDWGKFIIHFNSQCSRTSKQSYPGVVHDPQDIQIDKTGTMWVADSGDPTPSNQPFITLWKVPANGGSMSGYHFKYPDSSRQAEAMVLDGDGRPIFVTQPSSGDGQAGLYEPPAGALRAGTTVTMTQVGSFLPERTNTPNKLSVSGNLLVTGGAVSPDGTKVVLRTYSDAYEWTVSGGNVVAAITKAKPVITSLPDEPQGEAIAFTPDGKDFLTVSNVNTATPILKYTPATAPSAAAKKAKAPAGPKKQSALHRWFLKLSLFQLKLYLGLIAGFGFLLICLGVWGIVRSRRKQRIAGVGAPRPQGNGPRPDPARAPVPAGGPYGAATPAGGPGFGGPGSGGAAGPGGPGGGVYGGSARPAGPARSGAPSGGNVYGGAPSSGAPSGGGNVYGGRSGGGGGSVYGSPGAGPVYGAPRGTPDRGSRGDDQPGGYGTPPASGGQGGRGGQYSGGQYGTPVDPYDGAPDLGGRGRGGYPDEYGEYPT